MISQFLRKETKKAIQDLANPEDLLQCGLSESTVAKWKYHNFILKDEKIDCLIMIMLHDPERAIKVKEIIYRDLKEFQREFKELFKSSK